YRPAHPPRRGAARRGPVRVQPGGDRRGGAAAGGLLRPVRRSLPRMRRPRPAAAAPGPELTGPAVAAATARGVAAGCRPPVPAVPDHAGGGPGVPAGGLRPPGPGGADGAGPPGMRAGTGGGDHHPSPFARSLLFGYLAQFIYDTDAPLAERRTAALSLDHALLGELLGTV